MPTAAFPAPGPSIVVSPVNAGDSNSRGLDTCYCGIGFFSDGIEYHHLAASATASVSQGAWLDSGSASDVWVQMTETSGVFDAGPGTRVNLASDWDWYVIQSSVGSKSVSCYFTFYDAASGGNVLATSATNTYTATRT
jgi:hypothetical protein